MKIMVSACLLGENCKYNGGNNKNEELLRLLSGHTVIPVCPEVMGGLPVPRVPAEIVNGEVMTREGVSVDSAFRLGAEKALEIAEREKPDCVVLQSRSPSCGVKQRYDGTFSGKLIPGQGIFAEAVLRAGFRVVDAENAPEEIPALKEKNYVYLLRCADGTLYCGWTTDPEARLAAHNSGKGAKYTRSRLPVEMVWLEKYEDRHEALSREWHIKRMSRKKKLALIAGLEPDVEDRKHTKDMPVK